MRMHIRIPRLSIALWELRLLDFDDRALVERHRIVCDIPILTRTMFIVAVNQMVLEDFHVFLHGEESK